MTTPAIKPFWERRESVERFASRDPDLRLLELLAGADDPAAMRVLDLGCAGGRNTAVLAERGIDFRAVDASRAMVAHTKERVAEILGEDEAERRVRVGRMDDLGAFRDASFDLVIALGVYHCASSRAEWDRALAESARVLAPAGRLLVAVFSPETDPHGAGVQPVPGEEHVYSHFTSGRTFMVEPEVLDTEMARYGLAPVVPIKTVRVEMQKKALRVVINALYEARESA